MHDEVIVLTEETSADLPVAQQMFTEDTLITAPTDTMQTVFLGPYPAGLKIMTGAWRRLGPTTSGLDVHGFGVWRPSAGAGNKCASHDCSRAAASSWSYSARSQLLPCRPDAPFPCGAGVGLTLQGVDAHNVLATFNMTGGPNGTWSLSVDSVEQQPGSWLRLVRSELVLLDCAVAQALWRAAGLPAAQRPWGWNMTQVGPGAEAGTWGGAVGRVTRCYSDWSDSSLPRAQVSRRRQGWRPVTGLVDGRPPARCGC